MLFHAVVSDTNRRRPNSLQKDEDDGTEIRVRVSLVSQPPCKQMATTLTLTPLNHGCVTYAGVQLGSSCPGLTWRGASQKLFIYLLDVLCKHWTSSAFQIEFLNTSWKVPQCHKLLRTLFFFCNGMIFLSHQTTGLCWSRNNNPSWDMESLVKYNALGHKRAASSIQSQGCFKLFPYHYTLYQ